jgi:hypothetical protein
MLSFVHLESAAKKAVMVTHMLLIGARLIPFWSVLRFDEPDSLTTLRAFRKLMGRAISASFERLAGCREFSA